MVINESSPSMSTLPTQAITCTASDRRGSVNRDRRVHISEVQPALKTRDHEIELIESNLDIFIDSSLIFLNIVLRFNYWILTNIQSQSPEGHHNQTWQRVQRSERTSAFDGGESSGWVPEFGWVPTNLVYAIRRVYSMPIVKKNFRFGNCNRLRSTCWRGYITERIPYY